MTLTVSDVLEKAAELIEPEGVWCQGRYAADKDGLAVPETDPRACRWCAAGAISRVSHEMGDSFRAWSDTVEFLAQFVGFLTTTDWNDVDGRQQSEVVAALRAAAEAARGDGK